MYWSCGPRGVVAGARSRSLSGEDGPAWTTPAPVFVRHSEALTRAEACGWALIAATTCAAVLVIAPLAFVAGSMLSLLPARATLSAWLLAPAAGALIWAERLLPPRWPNVLDVSTTVPFCWAPAVGDAPATGRLFASKRTYPTVAVGPVPVAFV